MEFARKLKQLRAAAGYSQEKLAEKLCVSRQAVTKWETGRGLPEPQSLLAVARLFGVSVDALLAEEAPVAPATPAVCYESVTEVDIAERKHFDLKVGTAQSVRLCAAEGQKLILRLKSGSIAALESDMKVRLDESRARMDVEVRAARGIPQAALKEGLRVEILLPQQYLSDIELAANAQRLEIDSLTCGELEFDGKAGQVSIRGVNARVSLNCDLDMQIDCRGLTGALEVAQLGGVSRLRVPAGMPLRTRAGGSNAIYFTRNGAPAEDFSVPEAETLIELSGRRSELHIDAAGE